MDYLRGGHQTDTRKAVNTKKAFNPINYYKNYFNKVFLFKEFDIYSELFFEYH